MVNKNRFAKVNVKVLIILILVTAAVGTSLFTARHVRRSLLSKIDLETGQAAFNKQDWPTASRKLRGYLGRNPDDLEILTKYAKALLNIRPLNAETVTEAIVAYRRIIQLAPLDETAYEKLAMLYAGIGNFEELAYIARTRINHVPDDRKAPLWLAEGLFRLHKTNEAKEVLSKFLTNLDELNDKYTEYVQACALKSRIILNENSENAKAEALVMLNQAVDYMPESVEALVNRARFYRETPDIPSESRQHALIDLKAADDLSTENPRTNLSLGLEWIAHGELDKAVARLNFVENLPQETLKEYFFNIDDWIVAEFLFKSQLVMLNKASKEGVALSDEVLTVLKEKGHRVRVLPTTIRFYATAGKAMDARRCLDEYIDIIHTMEMPAESTNNLPYLQAQVAKAEGRLYAVINALQPAVVSDPSRPELWRLLAEAYSRTDQNRRAISALIQYLRIYPRDLEMTMQLAKEYLKQRDFKRAFETARLVEPMDPTDIIIRLLRIETSINIATDQTDNTVDKTRLEALSVELSELRKKNPDRVDIRIWQAVIAEYLEKPEEAEAELKLAIKECTEPLRAEIQLAKYYSRTERLAEAIKVCQAACERNSGDAEPWLTLSSLHVVNEDYDSARICLSHGIESTTDQWDKSSLSMRLAMLEILYADRATGINLLKKIATQDEQEVRARLLLLDIREIREDLSTAEKLISELRKAEGESGLYWRLHQASLWLSNENWRAKQQDIIRILKYCINSDPQWSLPVLLLARTYEQMEDYKSVETILRNALENNPLATDVADKLLSLLEKQGRFTELENVLQKIEANPRLTSSWNVRSAIRAGDFSRAIDELELRVSNNNRDANSRILLARLLYRQNQENLNQAFDYLKEAEEIEPESLALITTKVSILRGENRTEEAWRILDDYVADANTFAAYTTRAAYLAIDGQFERAEKDYKKLITFPDQNIEGYELLSNFYIRFQQLDKAIVTLDYGLDAHPENSRLKRKLMKTLLLQGRTESRQRAFEILSKLEEQFPQDPELMKLRAIQILEAPTPSSTQTAREILEKVIKLEPTAVDAHLALINIALLSGEYDTAREYATKALGSNSNNTKLMVAISKVELAIGNTQKATLMAKMALQNEPNNLEALDVLLNVAVSESDEDSGLIEEAIKSARIMLEEDPNHIEVRDIIVATALKSNNKALLQEARKMLEDALAQNPTDEKLLLSRTRVLVTLNLPKVAVPELEAYIQTGEGSQSIPAMVTLADLYRLDGDLDTAQKTIKRAELIVQDNQLVIHARFLMMVAQKRFDEIENISSAYLSAKEQNPSTLEAAALILASMDSKALKQEGIKLFEEVVSLSPSSASARIGLASTLYQIGDIQRAKQAYQKVLDIYPNNIQALNDLAWIVQKHEKRYDVALEMANRGLRILSDTKDRLHLLDTRGTILSNMPDRLNEARNDFNTLVKESPDDSQQKAKALLKLGRICMKQDNLIEAKEHLQRALEINKKINVLTPDERLEIERILQGSGIQAMNR